HRPRRSAPLVRPGLPRRLPARHHQPADPRPRRWRLHPGAAMKNAVLLIALSWSGVALADPCEGLDGMPEGPVAVGVRPGELGRAHRVCGRSEAAIGGSALLLADSPNFYGHIVGTVDLDG